MSRRYYKTKKVYPKQKWLPVNNEITVPFVSAINGSNYVVSYTVITQNSTRTAADGSGNISSASILKVGRFRFKGSIKGDSGLSYILGIAYIPEGYSINSGNRISIDELGGTFFYRHPEWLLAWTRLDYQTDQENEISLTSRLKRNLNTGDGIIFFRIAINRTASSYDAASVQGTISYVCRTN